MFSTAMQRLRGVNLRHPLLVDALLAAALAAPAAIAELNRGAHPGGPGTVGVAVFACVAVTVRRVWPMLVLLSTSVATLVYTLVTGAQQPLLMIPLVISAYTVATRIERRRMWLIATTIALPLYLAAVLTSSSSWWAPQNIATLAGIGMATAVGDATSSRRAYVAEVEDRARRAEQNREQEARRRVVEERIRIARELHDVVSHHIAVINVQAGAARHVLRHQPDAAANALEHIRRASDTVLRELASIVGVLRQADDIDNGTEPTRGLARLTALLHTVAAAGLHVDHHQHGDAVELPAMADLAAYRILQEALTNAHKHGTGTAQLTVGYTRDEVVLEVTNTARASTSSGGYGLIGMRERAAAAGGTLTARLEPGNRFRVHATLPVTKSKVQP
jgi:signal transduction histidine kinase